MDQKLPKGADRLFSWLLANQPKTSEGSSFEFDKRWYMVEPLCDFHPVQGWNKAGQMAASESVSLKALFIVQELHLNTIYTLPSDAFVQTFVTTKLDPIIDNNRHMFPDINGGVMLKQAGKDTDPKKAFLIMLGAHLSQSESNAQESSKGVAVTAHCVINDERSKSHPFVIDQTNSRLLNSPYRWSWSFDNPTFPGSGSDIVYRNSDMKWWIIKCSHCGWKQSLDWFKLSDNTHIKAQHTYIDDIRHTIVCGKCAKDISDYDRMTGSWQAMRPSVKDKRGYWFNQLMLVDRPVQYLLEQEADRTPSYFQNMIMGRPYVGADIGVNRETILTNIHVGANTTMHTGNNYMGVDVGVVKHYVIGNDQGIFLTGTTKSWEEIEKLFLTYNCKMVIDSNPDPKAKYFALKYPRKVWRAVYKNDTDGGMLIDLPDHDKTIMRIRREEMFDYVANKFNSQEMPLNEHVNELYDFINHWEKMHRFIKIDSYGNERFFWDTSGPSEADHFAHATIYFEAAKTRGSGVIRSSVKSFKKNLEPYEIQKPIKDSATIIKDFNKL